MRVGSAARQMAPQRQTLPRCARTITSTRVRSESLSQCWWKLARLQAYRGASLSAVKPEPALSAQARGGKAHLWLMDSPLLPMEDDTPGVASTEKPANGLRGSQHAARTRGSAAAHARPARGARTCAWRSCRPRRCRALRLARSDVARSAHVSDNPTPAEQARAGRARARR
jgi:hypothetical protein